MSESKRKQKNRDQELREAAAQYTRPPDASGANPEMLPGESPLHYTERRRRELDQLEKHSKPNSGEKPA
jgi:hypothetical protein